MGLTGASPTARRASRRQASRPDYTHAGMTREKGASPLIIAGLGEPRV